MQATRWGVVGLGSAGQSRLAAIAARPGLVLAGTVGRRAGRGTTTLDALCADATVQGVMVCSENAHHFAAARQALGAGKHVIVEFPLASTAAEAQALYALARAQGRVLHCELIGLLSGRHQAMKQALAGAAVERMRSRFTGRLYRWVAEEAAAGRWGQLAIGRLHALRDLFGPLVLVDARCERDEAGYRLTVDLRAGEVRLRLEEQRGPALGREASFDGRLVGGAPFEPPPGEVTSGLFGLDLDAALARIASGDTAGAYVADETIVEMLALAEQINARVA